VVLVDANTGIPMPTIEAGAAPDSTF
jgi:hypothetical protein